MMSVPSPPHPTTPPARIALAFFLWPLSIIRRGHSAGTPDGDQLFPGVKEAFYTLAVMISGWLDCFPLGMLLLLLFMRMAVVMMQSLLMMPLLVTSALKRVALLGCSKCLFACRVRRRQVGLAIYARPAIPCATMHMGNRWGRGNRSSSVLIGYLERGGANSGRASQ